MPFLGSSPAFPGSPPTKTLVLFLGGSLLRPDQELQPHKGVRLHLMRGRCAGSSGGAPQDRISFAWGTYGRLCIVDGAVFRALRDLMGT